MKTDSKHKKHHKHHKHHKKHKDRKDRKHNRKHKQRKSFNYSSSPTTSSTSLTSSTDSTTKSETKKVRVFSNSTMTEANTLVVWSSPDGMCIQRAPQDILITDSSMILEPGKSIQFDTIKTLDSNTLLITNPGLDSSVQFLFTDPAGSTILVDRIGGFINFNTINIANFQITDGTTLTNTNGDWVLGETNTEIATESNILIKNGLKFQNLLSNDSNLVLTIDSIDDMCVGFRPLPTPAFAQQSIELQDVILPINQQVLSFNTVYNGSAATARTYDYLLGGVVDDLRAEGSTNELLNSGELTNASLRNVVSLHLTGTDIIPKKVYWTVKLKAVSTENLESQFNDIINATNIPDLRTAINTFNSRSVSASFILRNQEAELLMINPDQPNKLESRFRYLNEFTGLEDTYTLFLDVLGLASSVGALLPFSSSTIFSVISTGLDVTNAILESLNDNQNDSLEGINGFVPLPLFQYQETDDLISLERAYHSETFNGWEVDSNLVGNGGNNYAIDSEQISSNFFLGPRVRHKMNAAAEISTVTSVSRKVWDFQNTQAYNNLPITNTKGQPGLLEQYYRKNTNSGLGRFQTNEFENRSLQYYIDININRSQQFVNQSDGTIFTANDWNAVYLSDGTDDIPIAVVLNNGSVLSTLNGVTVE